MLTQIVLAGSGGQGIQFAGQILAQAAIRQGLNATYVPAYGAERRGGPSFCSVVISDEPIYAPVFGRPDVLLGFDQRGRNQYGAQVKPDGLILANENLAGEPAAGEKARRVSLLPATVLAEKICKDGAMNLVMLGAYAALSELVDGEHLQACVKEKSRKKAERLDANLQALAAGESWGGEHKS